ncbi:BlaR1 family beta-lactam sensor/signal transducer [Pullulanibacillus camelliae]|uniref:BlaR1 family beta-lactam sensor/signal transducer n=1 Tax=Pullulanibacillus camelliae TaxID=1707096 RepID=A0A8J2YLX9_9BACL|nr:BlaR1 family beta-lactam sensor/signal transducer [Pullulanibacillus camelliae]GGE51673.1 BlaR1 family beta-lactam sensor/signal transducer [Pullulanibacillus camelliae]
MFLTHFLIGCIVSSMSIAIIMLIKKVFSKQLSARGHYYLWLLVFIGLTLPFISNYLFHFSQHFQFLETYHQKDSTHSSPITNGHSRLEKSHWMQDLTLSVNHPILDFLNHVLVWIWIIGVLLMSVLTLFALLKIEKIKRTTNELKNKDILLLFDECKQHLNLSKQLIIGESPRITSPMTFGLFKTYVVLPAHCDEWLSMKEMTFILLHELTHYKHKDVAINDLTVLYQILYWFNPLVWLAFRKMRLDREIACDTAVLNALDQNSYQEYGHTLIKMAARTTQPKAFTLANQLNGSKAQIKRRIRSIATFTRQTKKGKLKSIVIFMVVGLMLTSQGPFISAFAEENNHYDFKSDRVIDVHLSDYFDGFKGSFVLYDLKANRYYIYNEKQSRLRASPDSTYKIYSALFALEAHVITPEHSTIDWNGTQYAYKSWNSDQNLSTALKNSVTWYFQELDKRIGLEREQGDLNQIGYGNGKVFEGRTPFWLESSLKISPIEQVQLLKAFYTNQFKFKRKNIQTVKAAIKLEEKDGAVLSGKTGTGMVNHKNISGWFIGYVETVDNTYFFATRIQNDARATGSQAAQITLSILEDKGIY